MLKTSRVLVHRTCHSLLSVSSSSITFSLNNWFRTTSNQRTVSTDPLSQLFEPTFTPRDDLINTIPNSAPDITNSGSINASLPQAIHTPGIVQDSGVAAADLNSASLFLPSASEANTNQSMQQAELYASMQIDSSGFDGMLGPGYDDSWNVAEATFASFGCRTCHACGSRLL